MKDRTSENSLDIIAKAQGLLSSANGSIIPLNAGATFTGASEFVASHATIIASVKTDQDGILYMEFSPDGINWDSSISFNVTAGASESHRFIILKPYYRTRFTNTSVSNQTYFRLTTIFGAQALLNLPSNSSMQLDSDAIAVRSTDANLEVARGLRMGMSIININARNPDIDAGTETIWNIGGLWTPQTTARTLSCVSSSANDASAGTGARTILISGVDASRLPITEAVTLNGITPVVTVNTWLGVNNIRILTAGSGQTNVGNITLTSTTDGFIQGGILATQGQSFQMIYHIPVGYNAYFKRIVQSVNKITGGTQPIVTIGGYIVFFSGVRYLAFEETLEPSERDTIENDSTNYILIPGGAYVYMNATTDQANTNVYARLEGILVQN